MPWNPSISRYPPYGTLVATDRGEMPYCSAPPTRLAFPEHSAQTTDETTLVIAARAGDHGALDTLLRRHRKRLYRMCERHCDRPEDAADLFQETCVGIMRAIHGFRGESSFLTWAYLVARSQASRLRRRRKARPRIDTNIDHEVPICEPSLSPEHVVSRSRLQDRFIGLLEQLSPLDRRVLVLRDIEECTAPEVAGELGLTVSAVKSRLHRARRFVRTALNTEPRPTT